MIRIFFERILEWDWPEAPDRNRIFDGDIPARIEPLPKFLDDQAATKLMAAARTHRIPRYFVCRRDGPAPGCVPAECASSTLMPSP